MSGMRAFVVVAETGSVRSAATRLSYSESALGRHLRAFEQSLDVELFARGEGRLRLSPAGAHLLPFAQAILTLTDAMYRSAATGRPPLPPGLGVPAGRGSATPAVLPAPRASSRASRAR